MKKILALILVLLLVMGCGALPEKHDKNNDLNETINEKKYEERTSIVSLVFSEADIDIDDNGLEYEIEDGILKFNDNFYSIIEVDGGSKSGYRESNVAVDIGFGEREYWALTNDFGQLVYVLVDEIVIQDALTEDVNSDGRYYNDEAYVPGVEHKDLDQGHVIADSLGGVANAYNITPQNSVLNRGDQAYMEKWIREADSCINLIATIHYADNKTQIPSSYNYKYILNGEEIEDIFVNQIPVDYISVEDVPSSTIDGDIDVNDKGTVANDNSEAVEAAKIDSNKNGQITIKEAKNAGYSMPICDPHWLYKYMVDGDNDGCVGE